MTQGIFMDKDWIFTNDEYICDLRAVGVLIKDNRILVQRECGGNEFALPGGHIKIGETLCDGLIREFKEETDADIFCKRLLWTEECFWESRGKSAHTIAFYYLIDLCEGSEIPDENEFISHKDNCNVLIGWMPVDEIRNVIIYPEFLIKEIYNLTDYPKHFVSKILF